MRRIHIHVAAGLVCFLLALGGIAQAQVASEDGGSAQPDLPDVSLPDSSSGSQSCDDSTADPATCVPETDPQGTEDACDTTADEGTDGDGETAGDDCYDDGGDYDTETDGDDEVTTAEPHFTG